MDFPWVLVLGLGISKWYNTIWFCGIPRVKLCFVSYEYSWRNIKAILPETKRWKYKGIICHECSKRNIGTPKKRINKRIRVTPNFVEWSCTNKNNKLMRTLFFGRMTVHKERINERKKIMSFCRMVVCKWKKYINEDPNFWSRVVH